MGLQSFPASTIITGGNTESRKAYAYHMAMSLFCKVTDFPCGVCDQCRKIKAGSHPDFFYVGGEPVKVEKARELKKNASIKPSEAENKVFVIDECDAMTAQAQNALLKVLEEPSNAYFMLLCQNDHALLSTIRSRCQVFSVGTACGEQASPEILALARDFADALPRGELALCGVFFKVAVLSRMDFAVFLTLCRTELHRLLTTESPIALGKLLDIYQYFCQLDDDLVYNPSIFAACTCACSEIGTILNR